MGRCDQGLCPFQLLSALSMERGLRSAFDDLPAQGTPRSTFVQSMQRRNRLCSPLPKHKGLDFFTMAGGCTEPNALDSGVDEINVANGIWAVVAVVQAQTSVAMVYPSTARSFDDKERLVSPRARVYHGLVCSPERRTVRTGSVLRFSSPLANQERPQLRCAFAHEIRHISAGRCAVLPANQRRRRIYHVAKVSMRWIRQLDGCSCDHVRQRAIRNRDGICVARSRNCRSCTSVNLDRKLSTTSTVQH